MRNRSLLCIVATICMMLSARAELIYGLTGGPGTLVSFGHATAVGAIGGNLPLIGIAVAPVPEPSTIAFLVAACGLALCHWRRLVESLGLRAESARA